MLFDLWSILIYLFIYIFSCIFYIFLISSKRFLLLFKGDLYEVYPWVEEGVDDLHRSVHLHGVRDPVPPPLGRDLYLIHQAQHQSCILYFSQSLFSIQPCLQGLVMWFLSFKVLFLVLSFFRDLKWEIWAGTRFLSCFRHLSWQLSTEIWSRTQGPLARKQAHLTRTLLLNPGIY